MMGEGANHRDAINHIDSKSKKAADILLEVQ